MLEKNWIVLENCTSIVKMASKGEVNINYRGCKMVAVNNGRGCNVMTSINETPSTYIFDLSEEKHKSLMDTDFKLQHLMENQSVRWTELAKEAPEYVLRVFRVLLRGILEEKIGNPIYVTVEDDFLVFIHPPITRAGELKYQNMSDEDILSYVCDPSNMNRDLYYSSSEDESLEDDSSESESEEEDSSSDDEFNFDAFMKALSNSGRKRLDEDSHSDEE